jgi:hypothetical protein
MIVREGTPVVPEYSSRTIILMNPEMPHNFTELMKQVNLFIKYKIEILFRLE